VDEVGGEDELHALRLRLRQDLTQSLERCVMRVSDGDSFSLFASAAQSQLQLLADGRDFGHIVEEWDIPEAGANAEFLRRFKRHCSRRRTAIDVKEMVVAQDRHEFGHEPRIGGGLRTLVIIDANNAGNILQELPDEYGDLCRLHPRMQLLCFRVLIRNGLHRQMEQNLEAEAMCFFGNLDGMLVIRQNGNRQGVMKSKNGISGSAIASEIIENDGKAGSGRLTGWGVGHRPG
jgi:hypothetical protein